MGHYRKAAAVGLTMRIVEADSYTESRDALAQDWGVFMETVLPEVTWLPIPNIGKQKIVDYSKSWGIDAIIFTGGNDLGENKKRDETEEALLAHALSNRMPVVGICRGMQLFNSWFGGKNSSCPEAVHVNNEHLIQYRSNESSPFSLPGEEKVNSYHQYGIREEDLASPLCLLAATADGWVEACYSTEYPLLGLQWHPERGGPFRKNDYTLIRSVLGLKQ